jgi:23S rRNA pseudouridine2605 synthase
MSRRPKDHGHSPPRFKPRSPGAHRGNRPPAVSALVGDDEHEAKTHDRLQKVLAAAGIASRRECEQLILEGRVEVDRQVVAELGTRVDPQRQEIRVDGEALPRPKLVYFAVNKPEGVVSTSRDPAGRPRVIDLLPPETPRVFAVGRLDIASEGLILVTNDGELANGLTHPRHGVEKVYQVQVTGQVERDVLAQLHRGMHLAEGFAHAKHVRIKSRRKRSTILEMVLDEGRNREIRRLLARVGHKVQRLKRVAVGTVRLGELPTGAVRPLTKKEIDALKHAVHTPSPLGRGPVHTPSSLGGGPGKGTLSQQNTATREHIKHNKPKRRHRGHKDHSASRTIIGRQ